MKKFKLAAGGFIAGIFNVLFGAGGGMTAVLLLKKAGLSQKEAQATAVFVILPLTAVSCVMYYYSGSLDFSAALPYILPGIAGSVIGSFVLKKIPDNIMKKIFACFMLWAGARLVLK